MVPENEPSPMLKEINLGGIFIAPFAADLFCGLILFYPLRVMFDHWAIQRWVWHRPLFDLAVLVIIVSVIGLVTG
jgi:hypothetical protein